MLRVTVNDLQDQTNLPYPRPELHCFECGVSSSAHRGDYFMARPDRVFRCCGRPMSLVVRSEAFTEVG